MNDGHVPPPPDDIGEPLPGGPEWESVEQERDYWMKLALEATAKLAALKHTMAATWSAKMDDKGQWWITRTDVDEDGEEAVPMMSVAQVIEGLKKDGSANS